LTPSVFSMIILSISYYLGETGRVIRTGYMLSPYQVRKAYCMSVKTIILSAYQAIQKWPKKRLIKALEILKAKYQALETRIQSLETENAMLKKELAKHKIAEINKRTNKPSSKQPEWEDKGVGNDGGKKKKKRGKKGRKGAGNKRKELTPNRPPEEAQVKKCGNCGKDLSKKEALPGFNERIIEDIPEMGQEPEITLIHQEKKYCDYCQTVTTGKSELALPKSDIGINVTILICYLWVALCLPFTRISAYLKIFWRLDITTSGLSQLVIRVSNIFKDVYEEILQDISIGITLHADETGWRVKGRPWWLWVFGTEKSAYFTIDKSRGKDVVRRVLGEIFFGVLVVDGWSAYLSIICDQQSCMAHLLRKIRKLREGFPHLVSISRFYVKLRRILRDGEKLQRKRDKIGELVFRRRLKRLKERLEELLKWPNPDDILKTIIKKVKKQQARILTFVEHPRVPCHNNFGEYLIRIGVLKRKVSGGSMSSKGATAYAIILSVYVTCKLRKISFPLFIKESLRHYIKTGKPMLLKEYDANSRSYDLAKAA